MSIKCVSENVSWCGVHVESMGVAVDEKDQVQ